MPNKHLDTGVSPEHLLQKHQSEGHVAISALIESYRNGFLHLDQEQLESIWDRHYNSLIYVAQEKEEPIYGWTAIQQYFEALSNHLDAILAKHIEDVQIDILGDAAFAFFISRSSVRLKGRLTIYEPVARITMLFRRNGPEWRAIHYHESALSAQSAQAKSE